MNIHILIEASHTLAVDRGFWTEEKDLREEMLYIFSNVGDIVKSFKKNRRANWESYERSLISLNCIELQDRKFEKKEIYKQHIKDTFEDEIANVILRITDLVGGKKIDLISVHPWIKEFEYVNLNDFFRNVKPTENFNGNVAHWLNEALSMCMVSSDKDKDLAIILSVSQYIGSIATIDYAVGWRPVHSSDVHGNLTHGPMAQLNIPLSDLAFIQKVLGF